MFLVAYLCAFSLIGLMSMKSSDVVDRDGERKDTEKKSLVGGKQNSEKVGEGKSEEIKDKESHTYQTAGGPEGGPGSDFTGQNKEEAVSKEEKDPLLLNKIDVLFEAIKESIGEGRKFKPELALEFSNYLQDYLDAQKPFRERMKIKADKALKATKAGWKKIKENPKGAAAVVGGLATLGGAYFFREGIAQNIGKVKGLSAKGWSMAKEKGSSAWEYAREIPGKVKGKFKKG